MPRKKPNPVKREPVATATLVPIIVWLAAHFGFEVDAETATMVAGALLVVCQLVARSMVTPTDKIGPDRPVTQGH